MGRLKIRLMGYGDCFETVIEIDYSEAHLMPVTNNKIYISTFIDENVQNNMLSDFIYCNLQQTTITPKQYANTRFMLPPLLSLE